MVKLKISQSERLRAMYHTGEIPIFASAPAIIIAAQRANEMQSEYRRMIIVITVRRLIMGLLRRFLFIVHHLLSSAAEAAVAALCVGELLHLHNCRVLHGQDQHLRDALTLADANRGDVKRSRWLCDEILA